MEEGERKNKKIELAFPKYEQEDNHEDQKFCCRFSFDVGTENGRLI